MQTDYCFSQGSLHAVCQDSAATYQDEKVAIAVITDGCSSSPKSEVGSVLLANTFIKSFRAWREFQSRFKLSEAESPEYFIKADVGKRLCRIADEAGFDPQTGIFDATLVAAVARKEFNLLSLYVWGDGFVCLSNKDGTQRILRFNYASNAPYYYSYTMNAARDAGYEKEFLDRRATMEMCDPEKGDWYNTQQVEPLHSMELDLDQFSAVTVLSDGAASFLDVENRPIASSQVVKRLTAFKNLQGEFVKRRMIRFLREAKTAGEHHYDDLSAASISL